MGAPRTTRAASASASKATLTTPATSGVTGRGRGRPKGSKNSPFRGTLAPGRVTKRGYGRSRAAAPSPAVKLEDAASVEGGSVHAHVGDVTDDETGRTCVGAEEVKIEAPGSAASGGEGGRSSAAGRFASHLQARGGRHYVTDPMVKSEADVKQEGLPAAARSSTIPGQAQARNPLHPGFSRQLQIHRQLLSQILMHDQAILNARKKLLREFHPYLRLGGVQVARKRKIEQDVRAMSVQRTMLACRGAAVCAALKRAAGELAGHVPITRR